MYVSSMADQSGSPVNNTCQSSDDSVSLSSSTADSWSATRWLSRLADQYGFLKMGEPPDWSSTSWATSAQVSYYEDQSSSGLMAQTMDLMQSCNFLGVYWAHDNSLWGESTLPFSLYEQYVQLYQTPDVSFSSLTANEHIYSNSFAIPATASSNDDGNIASCELLVNGVNVATLTDSPYNFNLNTLGYSDGAYTVEVIAIDDEGNTNNSSASVLVTNGDLNSDGTVSLSDLAILATHWGETDSNYTDGNITGAATIGLSDLAVLAANWGWSD
jgi:hypothetical protein